MKIHMWQNKIKILIVDDNSDDLHFIKSAVEKSGYKTFILKKGDQALKFIKNHTIHAVIIDVMLPVKDGVSLAQEIQGEAHFKGPIFFISGVFKESDFIQSALKKTQAKSYFQKPFRAEDLVKELDTRLMEFSVDVPAATEIYFLITREFSSHEKKVRALEQTRSVSGLDFLCILSMLVDTKASGYINISCSKGLFGFTLYQGHIALFLSLNSLKDFKERLVKEEYLLEKGVRDLKSQTPFDLINEVLNLQCVSPHVCGNLLEKVIEKEIRTVIKEEEMKFNFVRYGSLDYKKTLFRREKFVEMVHNLVKNEMPYGEVRKFYTDLMDYPIHRRPEFGGEQLYLKMPLMRQNKFILEFLQKRPSLKEIIKSKEKRHESYIVLTIHFMVLIHVVTFGGRKKITDIPFFRKNVSVIWKNIRGKNPFEVFKYLGAGENAKDFVIERIYQEYRDLNHPGLLPIDAPEGVRKMAYDSLAEVTEAYQILSNEKAKIEMRKKVMKEKKESHMQLNRLISVLLEKIKEKEFRKVLEIIHESQMEDTHEEIKLYKAWAELKQSEMTQELYKLSSFWQKNLIILSQEIKQSSVYHFVIGLCCKGINEVLEARNFFSNALKLNENFFEAKVELQKIPDPFVQRKKTEKEHLNKVRNTKKHGLSSDIFNMIGHLFGGD